MRPTTHALPDAGMPHFAARTGEDEMVKARNIDVDTYKGVV
jgi:hypothetical protein